MFHRLVDYSNNICTGAAMSVFSCSLTWGLVSLAWRQRLKVLCWFPYWLSSLPIWRKYYLFIFQVKSKWWRYLYIFNKWPMFKTKIKIWQNILRYKYIIECTMYTFFNTYLFSPSYITFDRKIDFEVKWWKWFCHSFAT